MSAHQAGEPERQRRLSMDSTTEQLRVNFAEDFQDQLGNFLPGNKRVWEQSPLGMPETWSEALRAYSKTILSFAYPACVFWGEDMVLLHNHAWTDAGGTRDQGQKQRGKLSAEACNALSASLQGGVPKRVDSHALLRDNSADKAARYTVFVSPLFGDANPTDQGVKGSLVQLLPRSDFYHRAEKDRRPSPSENWELKNQEKDPESGFEMSRLGKALDGISFDEHPFFHRFAEMLPTGLAILDHNAQAVFVNQHFYQLTTHRGENREFDTWPQSIHPDDYERVMGLYHDAFVSQKQLRTEFRAKGEQHPWRLLFMTPLGGDNLQHVSLRENGGFVCSLVDITSEKSAEFAERKAATDARERREKQEKQACQWYEH